MVPAHRARRVLLCALAVLAALAALTAVLLHRSRTALQTTEYHASFAALPQSFDGFRAVLLSDLHGAVFGADNKDLLAAVAAAKPDIIAVTGDLADRHTADPTGYAAAVAEGLSAIAPTYYVTGNHEWAECDVPALKKALKENGVTVLSNAYLPLEREGERVLLAGIDDPNGHADQKTPEQLAAELYAEWGDVFWLLLAHRNDRFAEQYSLLGADAVLSGHGHGGMIRLPFTDGLFGTNHDLFPSYTAGLYEENGSVLLVSRGLGPSGLVPRLFNRPDVAVLTLHKG